MLYSALPELSKGWSTCFSFEVQALPSMCEGTASCIYFFDAFSWVSFGLGTRWTLCLFVCFSVKGISLNGFYVMQSGLIQWSLGSYSF